jgi:hypothetical protein
MNLNKSAWCCSTRPRDRGGARPGAQLGVLLAEGLQDPGQAAEWDTAGSGVACPLGRGQPAEQDAHRRALIGEHPDVALG